MKYKVNKQTIICGDCLKKLSQMEKESIDVVVTSPPYNLGIKYNVYDDNLPYATYLEWLGRVFAQINRVLKRDGSFFLQMGSTCKEPWRAFEVGNVAAKHFVLQNDIIWVKSISIGDTENAESYGHFKPINSNRFMNKQHESIFHFTKNGDVKLDKLAIGVPYQDKSNVERWKGKQVDLRDRGNVWWISYKTVQKKKNHPASFPVQLPEQCIKLHGVVRSDLVVLDPFLGGGTTLQACQNLKVNGIGIEMDEYYCEMAMKNINW